MDKLIGYLCIFLICSSLQAYENDYEVIARCSVQSRNGQKIKTILKSSLVHIHEKDRDTFKVTPETMRLWLEPRTDDAEKKAQLAGAPIDGTQFTPKPIQVTTFSFKNNGKTNAPLVRDKSASEQGTIDLINLMFYKGERATFLTENIGVMAPKYAKHTEYKVSGYGVALYVYWYDKLIKRKEKEAPTFMIIVKDQKNKMVACRVVYQAVKTTTKEISAFDLRSNQSDIDLNIIVKELNGKLNQGFTLRTLKWEESLQQ